MSLIGTLTSGVSAMRSFTKGLEVIGNNIANVNTISYKSSQASFADSFSNTLRGSAPSSGTTPNMSSIQVGTGVRISGITSNFTQGGLSTTGVGTDLGVFGAHDNVYFGRVEDGVLESEFSGNLTEVCPTGVFTDKTHSERYNRKWDMQFAPSICHGCSSGCNISPGERYGELRRIENRFNGSVNQYFLCDRGRFGYGYVNREDRPAGRRREAEHRRSPG